MKYLELFPAALLALASFPLFTSAAKCFKDTCEKEVAKNNQSPKQCKDFFRKTVIPAPTTVFVTVTSTAETVSFSTTTYSKRDVLGGPSTVSETTVPAYATAACHNTAAYSSACSCFGIKHVTTTAPRSTVTSTKMKTITTTYVNPANAYPTSCPTPIPSFLLNVTSGPASYVGMYVINGPPTTGNNSPLIIAGPEAGASSFNRDTNCTLFSQGGPEGNRPAYIANGDPSPVAVYGTLPSGFNPVQCGFSKPGKDGQIHCLGLAGGNYEMFFYVNCDGTNSNQLWIANGDLLDCEEITLNALFQG